MLGNPRQPSGNENQWHPNRYVPQLRAEVHANTSDSTDNRGYGV